MLARRTIQSKAANHFHPLRRVDSDSANLAELLLLTCESLANGGRIKIEVSGYRSGVCSTFRFHEPQQSYRSYNGSSDLLISSTAGKYKARAAKRRM